MPKPFALIANDDGIESPFLRALASAMVDEFDLEVAAPCREQSWTGKAMSRHRSVNVEPAAGFPCQAWSVDGTPGDCVNIALGHLLKRRPSVVVSGINVGYNSSIPMLLCSGTVAAASEAAGWKIPALAASLAVSKTAYEGIKSPQFALDADTQDALRHAARHTAKMARALAERSNDDFEVHNVNFPPQVNSTTPVVNTFPANLEIGSLYRRTGPGQFTFHFPDLTDKTCAPDSDWEAIGKAVISYSILKFTGLSTSVSF